MHEAVTALEAKFRFASSAQEAFCEAFVQAIRSLKVRRRVTSCSRPSGEAARVSESRIREFIEQFAAQPQLIEWYCVYSGKTNIVFYS